MKTFLIELFIISLLMSLVIAAFLLLSKKLEGGFRAKGRFIIWLIIIARLAIPVGGVLLPSLVDIPVETESTAVSRPSDSLYEPAKDGVLSENNAVHTENVQSNAATPSIPENKLPEENIKNEGTANNGEIVPNENKSPSFNKEYVPAIVFAVWFSGTLIFFSLNVIKYNLYIRKLRSSITPAEGNVVSVYEKLCRQTGLNSPPALYIGDGVHSPMLFGYFQKKIVLPRELCEDRVVRSVLLHELTHFRRGDIYLKLLSLIANSIHWFNPAVYFAAARFNVEMELSCDEITLGEAEEEERVYYGKAMLDIVSRCNGRDGVLTTKFDPKRSAFGMRIRNILDTRIKKTGVSVICACLAACLIVGVLFGCADNNAGTDGKKDVTSKQETTNTTADSTAEDTTAPAPEVGEHVKVFKTAKVGDVLDSPEIGVDLSKLCDFYVKTDGKISYGTDTSIDITISVSGYGTANTVCFILNEMASGNEAFGMNVVQCQFIILDNSQKTAKVYNSYEMDMGDVGNQSVEEQIDSILGALTTEGSFIDSSNSYTYELAKREMDQAVAFFTGIGFVEYTTNEDYRDSWMNFTKCEDEGSISVYSTNINGEEILFKINRETGLFKHASYNGVDHYSVSEYSFTECCHTADDIPADDQLIKEEDKNLSEPLTLEDLDSLSEIADDIKNCTKAFLTKNTAELERLTGCAEGVLAAYGEFEFGDYTIRRYNDTQYLRVDVNIEKSPLDTVAEGEHILNFGIGPNGVNISGLNKEVQFVSGEGRFFMQAWIAQMGTALIPDEDTVADLEGYHRNIVDFMFQVYLGPIPAEEYKNAAKKIFGIEDIQIPDDFINADGNVEVGGHGGYVKSFDIISIETEGDFVTVTVQTYGDNMKTVKAMLIENTFRTDGDYLTVVSSEIIEDAGIGEYGFSI